jgi:WD40 repeat protein
MFCSLLWSCRSGTLCRVVAGRQAISLGVGRRDSAVVERGNGRVPARYRWSHFPGQHCRLVGKWRAAPIGIDDIQVWDAATGQLLRLFDGHSSRVSSAAWSPNGRHILSGSHDETLRLWDVVTGECLRTFKGHTSWVDSVAWSPDGSLVVSGSADKTLRLWSAITGMCLRILEAHSSGVTSVAWSPDGKHVLSGSTDRDLRLWDANTGECLGACKHSYGRALH